MLQLVACAELYKGGGGGGGGVKRCKDQKEVIYKAKPQFWPTIQNNSWLSLLAIRVLTYQKEGHGTMPLSTE